MQKSCAVIGAGISGLTAAKELQSRSWQVQVFDKGRGVGGRLATRRWENAVFDHGAQYASLGVPEFDAWIGQLIGERLAKPWPESNSAAPFRFCASHGMSAWAKNLAQGLSVQLDEKLLTLEAFQSNNLNWKWRLKFESGMTTESDAVIITSPLPQTLEILGSSGLISCHENGHAVAVPHSGLQQALALGPDWLQALRNFRYDPCLVGLFVLNGPSQLSENQALSYSVGEQAKQNHQISWIADNTRKGLCDKAGTDAIIGAGALTVHMNPEFSLQHFDQPEEQVLTKIKAQVASIFQAKIVSGQLKKWRYSQPAARLQANYFRIPELPAQVYLAGDAFGGPHVRGAYQSGLRCAQALDRNEI